MNVAMPARLTAGVRCRILIGFNRSSLLYSSISLTARRRLAEGEGAMLLRAVGHERLSGLCSERTKTGGRIFRLVNRPSALYPKTSEEKPLLDATPVLVTP